MNLFPTSSGTQIPEVFAGPIIQLAENPLQQRRWPLLKPVDGSYLRSGGRPPVDLTPELLQTLAAVYDPAIDAAPLKFDHVHRGPAEGWVRRVVWEKGVLWIEPLIFASLEEGIRSGRWGRLSAEIHPKHPETKTPYLTGVAVLGAASPVIKSLPFKEAAGGDRPPLIHLAAQPAATPEDPTMDDDTRTTPPPPASQSSPPARQPVGSQAGSQAGAQTSAPPAATEKAALELSQRLERMNSQLEAQTSRLEALTRQNAAISVANRLDALGTRLPLGMRRALEPVLVHLASSPAEATLQLSQGEETVETTPTEAIYLALTQLPERLGELGREIAGQDDPQAPRAADPRSKEQRALDLELGVSDDEALELLQKYPSSFAGSENASTTHEEN